MKGRVILIDMPEERVSQAALVVDGRLEDLLVDRKKGDDAPAPGEIYWAKVDRLVPNMGGAFVKLTPRHMGFLREAQRPKSGEGVLVQVSSYPEPGKAVPVTARLLYKGRRIIHTPGAPGINVSRKIKDPAERERLLRSVADWKPDPCTTREPAASWYEHVHNEGGFIVRAAAHGIAASELQNELSWILAMRSKKEGISRSSDPGTVEFAAPVIGRALREWTGQAGFEIVLGPRAEREISAVLSTDLSASSDIETSLFSMDGDPFDELGVWDEIDGLRQPRVDLPSGAWMAIETTRALVTVDVNTGDQFGGGAAMTANIEAARELPRQLRLRGLGGQIVIDFAPLKKVQRKKIEETLKSAFRKDPIGSTLAGWTPLGNFELQRKRERRPLSELLTD